jgi:hypothetical protein
VNFDEVCTHGPVDQGVRHGAMMLIRDRHVQDVAG